VSRTRWVLGENHQIVKSPEKVRKGTVEKVSHEVWDCQEIPRRAQGGTNFTVKLQAEGRQLSLNRESATEFAMKYAIGEILFLEMRLG
jgi:hypothetical protein